MSRTAKQPLEPDLLECLLEVMDPEIGLSIVDLGLVYRAARTPDAIEVDLTLTTRACPLGEMIAAEARERLAQRFQDPPRIDVRLVWAPAWSPDLITDRGRARLGHPPRSAA
jgi:metal-sulfur cluster biosynthetic enzyme